MRGMATGGVGTVRCHIIEWCEYIGLGPVGNAWNFSCFCVFYVGLV